MVRKILYDQRRGDRTYLQTSIEHVGNISVTTKNFEVIECRTEPTQKEIVTTQKEIKTTQKEIDDTQKRIESLRKEYEDRILVVAKA